MMDQKELSNNSLQSIIVSKSGDKLWEASHIPSGKKAVGDSPEEATAAMRQLLGLSSQGTFSEPATNGRFKGIAQAVAIFLEGPISETLSFHAGWARLESFEEAAGIAKIKLGGGCQGCPSSQITLFQGVKDQLQSRFGEEVIRDVELHV